MHKEILAQDKPHNSPQKKTKVQADSCTIWEKYVLSQKYAPVYLKYAKESITELYAKSFKKYKLEMSRCCHNNTNLFSSYLIDLAFLNDYGTYLLQNLKPQPLS